MSRGEIDILDALKEQVQNFAENILPANPVTNNLAGPLLEAAMNKNWMGYEIVDSGWEKKEDGFHYLEYDEDTTEAAKAIANFGHYITGTIFGREDSRILDFSPKKIDYLLQQYFGSYSGIVTPFLYGGKMDLSAKGYEALMSMARKFYLDPVYSNGLANDYYAAKNYADAVSDVYGDDTPYSIASRYFRDHGEKLKEIRSQIDEVNADTSLSRKERQEKARKLREQLNELYRQGLREWKDILATAMETYDGKDRRKETYADAVASVAGAEYYISTLGETGQEQYKTCSADGVDAETFYRAYQFHSANKPTRDENGNTVEGRSKKDKYINYLNGLDISAEQKRSLFLNVGGYSEKKMPLFADGVSNRASLDNLKYPLGTNARLSSGFGNRNCPFHGSEFHAAVDLACPKGTAVGASLSGVVTHIADSNSGYGKSVEITSTDEDGNTIVQKFSHLANFGVEVGQQVAQGAKIGEVNSTGSSTGNHLDFRLQINGEWKDPAQYLDLTAGGDISVAGYTVKGSSGGTAAGGSSGGGKSGRGRSGGGSKGSYSSGARRTTAPAAALEGTGSGGRNVLALKPRSLSSESSSVSGGSAGGGVVLPTAAQHRAITARSTQSPTYAKGGITLPTAKELARIRETSIAANKGGRETPRTGRSTGSFWDESILG